MPRLSLVAKFSVTSFVLLAVIAVLLGMGLSDRLKEQAIEQQKLTVSALVPPIVGWHLTDDLLANGARGKSYQEIDDALSYLGGLGLVRVRIVNTQGVIVYADNASLVGQKETG